ncbi:hypothetical protein [Microbispora sp. H10836]|uniref:hypothetical protein n=1 Tax=Microbispora sp. H10836 TaxID=2729106 RepID=UPI0037CA0586
MALGDFRPNTSDVDFVAVIAAPSSPSPTRSCRTAADATRNRPTASPTSSLSRRPPGLRPPEEGGGGRPAARHGSGRPAGPRHPRGRRP